MQEHDRWQLVVTGIATRFEHSNARWELLRGQDAPNQAGELRGVERAPRKAGIGSHHDAAPAARSCLGFLLPRYLDLPDLHGQRPQESMAF